MDTKKIRQILKKDGWCGVHADGYFYMTIGNHNGRKEPGWEYVGTFSTEKDMALVKDRSLTPNLTVFRRPAPSFYQAENPWSQKGKLTWLPDLTFCTNRPLAKALSQSGGHGSPGMARRFQCACGEQSVTCLYNANDGKAEAKCPSCKKRTLICDVQQEGRKLKSYTCDCGSKRVVINLGIEYAVDSEEGWDFSWITVAVTCSSCGESVFLFNDETA